MDRQAASQRVYAMLSAIWEEEGCELFPELVCTSILSRTTLGDDCIMRCASLSHAFAGSKESKWPEEFFSVFILRGTFGGRT